MEENPDIKKPSFWNKAFSSLWFGFVASWVTILPLVPTLFMIKKGPRTEKQIAFWNKMNDLSYKWAWPSYIAGAVYGWFKPEHEYLKNKSTRLQNENTLLKNDMDALKSGSAQKSWAESERAKFEPTAKTGQAL